MLLAGLLGLLLAVNAINVAISYVGRDFMTAFAERAPDRLVKFGLLYLAVFAAATVAAALARYVELLLGLRWREWLTHRFCEQYLTSQAYHRLNTLAEVDNPDERIADDVKTFTATTLSFLVMLTNSLIGIVAFVGVLWSITPWLLVAGVLYPLFGTSVIVAVGRRLVELNNQQLKKEADFRFELVQVRAHAEAIALDQAEAKQQLRLDERLAALVANYSEIIRVIRNLQFVSNAYNYLNQLIPLFIVAPLYLRGEVEFGVVTQSAMAFSLVFNAFSLIAERFQDLSAFAAVVGRVGVLEEALNATPEPSQRPIQVVESDAPVAWQQVTLRAPHDDRVLVQDVNLEVPRGSQVLVTGQNTLGVFALFRATAGLWPQGQGRVLLPATRRVLFLPEQPYMIPGTLREQFIIFDQQPLTDQRIGEVMASVGLGGFVERFGGLDTRHDWSAVLGLAERQRLAFARLLLTQPDCAFLDRAASALCDADRDALYRLLAAAGLTYVSVGDPSLGQFHLTQLELRPDGSWFSGPIAAAP